MLDYKVKTGLLKTAMLGYKINYCIESERKGAHQNIKQKKTKLEKILLKAIHDLLNNTTRLRKVISSVSGYAQI